MIRRLLAQLFSLEEVPALRRVAIVAAAVVIMTLFGLMDFATRNAVEWSIAYAVCVAFAAWYGGLWAGLPLALYAGVLSLATAALAGGPSAVGEEFASFPISVILALFASSLVVLRQSLVDANLLARTDQLTGVANSRAFYEAARAELARAGRYGGVFTLAYIDVDDFKSVNDQFGHAAGDELLKSLARTLTEDTRSTDEFARMGGDEFVLLMPETGQEAAAIVLDKLAERTAEELSCHGWDASLSIGAVTFLGVPESADAMVGEADAAMYAAKRSGRARTVLRVHRAQAGEPERAAAATRDQTSADERGAATA